MSLSLVVARRHILRWVLSVVRRSPIFPRTVVNRHGDDDALAGKSFDESVMVYFPGAPDSLYQVLPWLGPLRLLHHRHPVVIVCQDSRVAAELRRRTEIRVVTIARYGRLDDLLQRSDVKLALYVSHTPRNFECLRFTSLIHVYLGHGDSDKGVSASNQLKAYDYAMVPGQAAVDRIAARLIHYDVAERCIVIGHPQRAAYDDRRDAADERCTVLYAPTWEGAQPSVAYSSLVSHGPAMVRSLLADPRFRVVFRPHPLSGVTSGLYSRADKEIAAAIREALRTSPSAGHRTVRADDEPLETSFAAADLLVCDVSAVATAWLTTGRPIVVTIPASPHAAPADSGLLAAVPRLTAEQSQDAADLLWREHEHDTAAESRGRLADYYFAETGSEDPAGKFITACTELIGIRDTARMRLLEMGGGAV
ncbi:CDP-glycerol glycerophosphotransferase family protein [Lysobacter korlensis]|uniref:CDP-glycerol glycerophosphotransferase family protein n=1 Tax=Lysobacter korlensis TaxID=553636 RepID=A0ABV6RZH7_9GAMM